MRCVIVCSLSRSLCDLSISRMPHWGAQRFVARKTVTFKLLMNESINTRQRPCVCEPVSVFKRRTQSEWQSSAKCDSLQPRWLHAKSLRAVKAPTLNTHPEAHTHHSYSAHTDIVITGYWRWSPLLIFSVQIVQTCSNNNNNSCSNNNKR